MMRVILFIFVVLKLTCEQLPSSEDVTSEQKAEIIKLIENEIGFKTNTLKFYHKEPTPGTADIYTRAKSIDSIKELTDTQIKNIISEYLLFILKSAGSDSEALSTCSYKKFYPSILNATSCSYTLDESTHQAKIDEAVKICTSERISEHSKMFFMSSFALISDRISIIYLRQPNNGKLEPYYLEVIQRNTRKILESADKDITFQMLLNEMNKVEEVKQRFLDIFGDIGRYYMIECEAKKIFESEHPSKRSNSLTNLQIIIIVAGSFILLSVTATVSFFLIKARKRSHA